jgi:DNA sulfur modification protein DndD
MKNQFGSSVNVLRVTEVMENEMLLRRLVLEDFGIYSGKNEVDFTPRIRYRQRRPVVLIGGKNGSGKTSLLEAIRLCLYGPLSLGSRVSVREYEGCLADRIHRSDRGTLIPPSSASVTLEFEYAQAGIKQIYSVERRWEHRGGSVKNFLTVLRDGQPLDELDKAHADDFLRDLIPSGVSQLFFFDGEKIQQLAETEQDHLSLAEAIRGLIGLELLERLQGDLRVYRSRVKDAVTSSPLEAERTRLAQERQSLEQQRRQVVNHLDECQAKVDRIRQDVSREEQRLASAGGGFANKRDALRAEKEQLQTTLDNTESELREFCEGLLPFTLASGLCDDLRKQIEDEGKVLTWKSHQTGIKTRIVDIKKAIGVALTEELSGSEVKAKVRKSLTQRLEKVIEQLADVPKNLPKANVIHKHSEDDRRQLMTAIQRILEDVPKQLAKLQTRLEKSTRRIQIIESALEKIPQDEILQPVLESLQKLYRELGTAQGSADRAELDVREIDHKLTETARQEKRNDEKIASAEKIGTRGALVIKVQSALEDYARVLTESKIQELINAVVRCFAQLWRKGDVVRRIEIDPRDFRVTLFDRQDRVIPKQQLSAGEKQIYAISMLWALGQVSGRPLPMVIDTPLGRLDSDHRSHLVERYFPNASHQVIILSTDTEIDQTYFNALRQSISHSYHLQYDPAEGRCIIDKGYFWSSQQMEDANAG